MFSASEKGRRYGLVSGMITFAAGWLVVFFLLPASDEIAFPRWQWTLMVYVGTNISASLDLLEILGLGAGGMYKPVALYWTAQEGIITMPGYVFYTPIVASGVAAIYTCYQTQSNKTSHNISNALAAGSGYFLAAIGVTGISNIDPRMGPVYAIGFVIVLGFWLGSAFIGNGRNIPFIDITVIGSLVALVVMSLLTLGDLFTVVFALLALPMGTSLVVGSVIGSVRQFRSEGEEEVDSFTPDT